MTCAFWACLDTIQRASCRLRQTRMGSAPGEAEGGCEEKEALRASFGKNQVRRREATGRRESCSGDRQARLTSSKTGMAGKGTVPGAGSSHRGAVREGRWLGSWVAVKL